MIRRGSSKNECRGGLSYGKIRVIYPINDTGFNIIYGAKRIY